MNEGDKLVGQEVKRERLDTAPVTSPAVEDAVVSPNDMPLSRLIDWGKKYAADDGGVGKPMQNGGADVAAPASPAAAMTSPSDRPGAAGADDVPDNAGGAKAVQGGVTSNEAIAKRNKTLEDQIAYGRKLRAERGGIARREDRAPAYADAETRALQEAVQRGGYDSLSDEQKAKVNASVSGAARPAQSDDALDVAGSSPATPPNKESGGNEKTKSPAAAVVETNVTMPNSDGAGASENGGQSHSDETQPSGIAGDDYIDYLGRQSFGTDEKPTEAEYNALKEKQRRGDHLTGDDRLKINAYEKMPGDPPKPPEYEDYEVLPMPPASHYTKNYDNAYATMLERMRAYGDDPASKAKRAKAARAARIVAMIGDLLQASVNMWGAYKGAQSAKLSSQSKAVRDEAQKEEALAMKRAEHYTKALETARKSDVDMNKAIDSRLLAQWKELNKARAELVKNRNASRKETYERAWQRYLEQWRDYDRLQQNTRTQYNKEVNAANQNAYRLQQQNNQYRNQASLKRIQGEESRKTKSAPTYSDTQSGGGGNAYSSK